MWLYGALPLASQPVASAALGSNSILPQQGSFTKTHTVALSGSEAAFSQGDEVPNRSVALDANAGVDPTQIASFAGNVTYVVISGGDIEVFLLGEDSDVGHGTLKPDRNKPLSGSEAASAQGTGIPGITPTTLVTQLIQPAAGTLVYTPPGAGDVTVNINAGEMEINSFVGSVKTASPLVGSAVTSALQSFAAVSNTPTDTLLGQSFTAQQTSVTVDQGVEDTYVTSGIGSMVFTMVTALSGSGVAFSQGTVGVTGDVTVALTGQASTTGIGDVTDGISMALTGIEMLGEQTDDNFGLPLNIELTGSQSLVEAGTVYLDNDRSYPLVGTQVLVETTNPGLFTNAFVNGEFIFLSQEGIGPRNAELSGQGISVEQGRIKAKGKDDGAGKPPKDKKDKKKKKVTVDGQLFEVDDEELAELLVVAKEIATAKAKEEADAAVAAKSTEKIRLKVPKVTGSEELKDAIADIYMQATIDAEVSRNRQLDEEEALVLLLLN